MAEPSYSNHRLYDRNFFLGLICLTSFVCANTLMAHYARWIEFLGGDLRQVGLVMGFGATVGLAKDLDWRCCLARSAAAVWLWRRPTLQRALVHLISKQIPDQWFNT